MTPWTPDRNEGQNRQTTLFFQPLSKIVAGRSVTAFAGGHAVMDSALAEGLVHRPGSVDADIARTQRSTTTMSLSMETLDSGRTISFLKPLNPESVEISARVCSGSNFTLARPSRAAKRSIAICDSLLQ
jgi:hypothetical protein